MQSVFRFWFFKFVALVAITVGAFNIPDGPFTYSKKLRVLVSWAVPEKWLKVTCASAAWFVVGSCGAFFFILIQLVLLVDFAHSWNESWMQKMESGSFRGWYAGW